MAGHDERLVVVDDSESLTLQEVRELKRLAQLSKTTRALVGIAMGVVMLVGLPQLVDWFKAHF